MPRTYTPRPKLYTEASIAVAIEEVNNGASVKSTAIKYIMSTSMLRMRVQVSKGIITLQKQGVKCRIPHEKEVKLKKRQCINMHGSILTNAEYKKQTEEKNITTKVVSRKRSALNESDTDSSEDSPELEREDSSNSDDL
ncbi:UNVERIFIED_CONTAM: hypothetical protein RMT77_011085 [Armadillidium vulgare]